MRRHLPPLRALVAFEAAARHLSFTRAGKELAITQGAISAQIANLEDYLQTRLFVRKVREVALTAEGEQLARSCLKAFDTIERDVELITHTQWTNILTVAVSTYVTTRWLSRHLSDFLSRHADTVVRFQHSVNAPEFEIDDVDIAIRWGDGQWSRSTTELLLPMQMKVACSPQLLTGRHAIRTPRDLLHHTFLCDVPEVDRWGEWLQLVDLKRSEVRTELVMADANVRVQAAIDSQGVVLADDLIADDVASGRLIIPFDVHLDGYGYYVLWQTGVQERAIVEQFRRWLIDNVGRLADRTHH